MVYEISFYRSQNGELVVRSWLETLDSQMLIRIYSRLDRVKLGNLGDHEYVGDGVYELRFFFGSGYRIYFAKLDGAIILLLNAGDKKNQSKDIKKAKQFWLDFQRRHK